MSPEYEKQIKKAPTANIAEQSLKGIGPAPTTNTKESKHDDSFEAYLEE
jgi:hypothetical protein